MRELRVRRAAELEIAEAVLWYEERRAGLGRSFLQAIDAAFAAIVERPEAWPSWRRNRPHRKYHVPSFPFVVFYKLHDRDVVIVAVAHTHRKPGYWVSREP